KRKQPVIVFDPIGTITDYYLGEDVPERVIYVDMSSKEYTVPFPLFHRFAGEPIFDMAQRFPETMRLSDPSMLVAPIQGYNPFQEIATHIGTLLYALDLPLMAA